PGTRIFFWNSTGQVVYADVESSSRLTDGTQILVLRTDDNRVANMPYVNLGEDKAPPPIEGSSIFGQCTKIVLNNCHITNCAGAHSSGTTSGFSWIQFAYINFCPSFPLFSESQCTSPRATYLATYTG
ncbi:hypothetical protein BKA70DRAFT_1096865, partial [Coprinopsis sp. MPI-PUGE-AT-0042]